MPVCLLAYHNCSWAQQILGVCAQGMEPNRLRAGRARAAGKGWMRLLSIAAQKAAKLPFFKGDAFPDHRKPLRFLPVFTTHTRAHTLYTTKRPSSSARQEPRIRRPTFSSPPSRTASLHTRKPRRSPPRSPPRAHALTPRVPPTSRGDVLSPRLFREPPAQVARLSPLPGPPGKPGRRPAPLGKG